MANNRNKNKIIKYTDFEFETLDCTSSASGGSEQAIALSALLETLQTGGHKAHVRRVRVQIRHTADEYFAAQLVVVQTAGTWSQVLDGSTNVDTILDASIDDVFGSSLIGPYQLAKRAPVNDPTVSSQTMTFIIETTRELPQHLVQILNKEVSTERLQNLFIGSIFTVGQGASQINSTYFIEIDYTLDRKTIVLR